MNNILKRSVQTLAIPVGVWLILVIITTTNGTSLFETGDSWLIFTRSTAMIMLTTLALAINLSSGRFDFSLGAVATLSSAVGALVALELGAGWAIMLLVSILTGVTVGAIHGLLYVSLGIPPIILSLGFTLILEGVAFTLTSGASITFLLNTELISFSRSSVNMLVIIGVALVSSILLFDKTKFGYDYKALSNGQKVAVNTGIKEKNNAVICYAISGALMSVVGFITASQMGHIATGTLNFGSIGIMFTAFLPMFIGGYIGQFSNDKLGYLLGSISMSLIGLAYSALRVDAATQSIITAVLLVLFLIYLNNNWVIAKIFVKKSRDITKGVE